MRNLWKEEPVFAIIGGKEAIPLRKLTPSEISERLSRPRDPAPKPRVPVIGLLDNIRSLYNVGSIFRTSDGAFVQELLLCGFTPHPPRPEISKTALGATETVPWRYFKSPLEAVAAAREIGARICVLEHTSESKPYTSLDPSVFPLCLVVGNELTGVSAGVVQAADIAIEIPMHGAKQSLNAAVAYGIAIFELARIWRESAPQVTPTAHRGQA